MNKADSIVEENNAQVENVQNEELNQELIQESSVEETVASNEPDSNKIEESESDIIEVSDSDASEAIESELEVTDSESETAKPEGENSGSEIEAAEDESETSDSESETIETETPDCESNDENEAEGDDVESEETAENVPFVLQKAPYHERYYLKYHEGKRTTELDLTGTRAFLQEAGFDGGELKQAREGKDCAENLRNIDQNKNNQTRCSYCGKEISGIDFYKLPDGRVRCTTCSNTIVKTKAEIEALFERVVDNLENFFGATIDVPISIEVTDERKLKKKLGVPLGAKDDQSILILGVAISKKKKYSIILENGAPRISLIATFAHELTHIWQYTHWDNNKKFKECPKDKRLLIYEGMAKWAEIQYLYLVGETTVAKREEFITRNREDEYGIGFCLYEDAYPLSRETMTCEETPFTPDKYPI